jgi:hypothetical protein
MVINLRASKYGGNLLGGWVTAGSSRRTQLHGVRITDNTASSDGLTVNNKLVIMCKDPMIVRFRVLSRNLPDETARNHDNFRMSGLLAGLLCLKQMTHAENWASEFPRFTSFCYKDWSNEPNTNAEHAVKTRTDLMLSFRGPHSKRYLERSGNIPEYIIILNLIEVGCEDIFIFVVYFTTL